MHMMTGAGRVSKLLMVEKGGSDIRAVSPVSRPDAWRQ